MSRHAVLGTLVEPGAGMRVEVVTESGSTISLDSSVAAGELGLAGPMEALLASLAACTAADVVSILRKKRQTVREYQIAVTGERATEHPRTYTRISVEHRVTGDVEPEALRRSVELSATKYCPVSATLSRGTVIEHGYRLWQGAREGEGLAAPVAITGPEGSRLA